MSKTPPNHWLGETFNQAFDWYYFSTASLAQKEQLFTDQLYPAYYKLASSIVYDYDYNEGAGMNRHDLISELVVFAWQIGKKYEPKRKAARSSFIVFCMQRQLYQYGIKHTAQKKRLQFVPLTATGWEADHSDSATPVPVTYPEDYSPERSFLQQLHDFWQGLPTGGSKLLAMAQQIYAVLAEYVQYRKVYVKQRLSRYGPYYLYCQAYTYLTTANQYLYAYFLEQGCLPQALPELDLPSGFATRPSKQLVWAEPPEKPPIRFDKHEGKFIWSFQCHKKHYSKRFACAADAEAYAQEQWAQLVAEAK